jgi:hypothetical protein
VPPRSRRPLLLGLIALLVVLAVVVSVAVVQRDDGPATETGAPVAQDQPGPVLLVPGYGGSAASVAALAGELRAAGRTVSVIEPPGDGRGDLRDTARVLLEESDRALRTARPASTSSATPPAASSPATGPRSSAVTPSRAAVVTRGLTHHGTSLAALGARVGRCPPGCEQLVPDSDLLTDLNADDETPDGPLWTTIWTDQDETVTPPDSARLDGATQVVVQQVCPGTAVAHGELPQHPLVTALVLEALAADPPPASYGPAGLRPPVDVTGGDARQPGRPAGTRRPSSAHTATTAALESSAAPNDARSMSSPASTGPSTAPRSLAICQPAIAVPPRPCTTSPTIAAGATPSSAPPAAKTGHGEQERDRSGGQREPGQRRRRQQPPDDEGRSSAELVHRPAGRQQQQPPARARRP